MKKDDKIMESYKKLYQVYKSKSRLYITFDDFMIPQVLINTHEKNVGTVFKGYNKHLAIYDHIIYFGCMLFFEDLTQEQLENGPQIYVDAKGAVCAF